MLRGAELMEPVNTGDPKQRRPDIGQAQGLLDWSPKIPLATGLQRTISYFSGQIERAPRLGEMGAAE